MTKLQLTLTTQETDILSAKAAQLGYNLTRFVKFLIGQEAAKTIDESNIPVFKMSKRAEKVALQAQKDYKEGKALEIKSFKDLDKIV